jgi:endonuclease G
MKSFLAGLALALVFSSAGFAQDSLGSFHSKHWVFGPPSGAPADNDLIIRDSYAMSNNRTTKFADWVAYRLTPQEVAGTVDLERHWRADPWLAEDETLEPSGPDDYTGAFGANAYHRGHQAPLASFNGSHAARELNYLSNITPQRAELNGGPWSDLEELERDYVRRWQTIWVMTGPLYESPMPPLPAADEPHTVPSGYWKIVVDWDSGDNFQVAAFIMGQNADHNDSVAGFAVTVDEIETRSGLAFFTELSANRQADIKARNNISWLVP